MAGNTLRARAAKVRIGGWCDRSDWSLVAVPIVCGEVAVWNCSLLYVSDAVLLPFAFYCNWTGEFAGWKVTAKRLGGRSALVCKSCVGLCALNGEANQVAGTQQWRTTRSDDS